MRKGNPAKVLADPPNVDGSKSENRSLPEGLPIRRIGLEQEFFLVDRRGAPQDLADPFLRRCREAAQAAGLDPRCFKAECSKGLLEIATQPSHGVEELAKEYLNNLHLALGVASELGLALYPLGTYPLPIRPALRDDPSYSIKARTIGYERFLGAGTHLHLELPAGTVWPDVKAALDAPIAAQQELLGLYNLATALDPALVALTRACPFYEGRADGFAARTVHYRGILGFEGGTSLTRDQGLSLVREACRRMSEQVSSLRRTYDETPPDDEHDPEAARVIYIRDSPTVYAEEVHQASVEDAQATARAANKELA